MNLQVIFKSGVTVLLPLRTDADLEIIARDAERAMFGGRTWTFRHEDAPHAVFQGGEVAAVVFPERP